MSKGTKMPRGDKTHIMLYQIPRFSETQLLKFIEYNKIRAAPRNSARSLRQDFCPNSKFGKRRNTVCISRFSNGRSGAKRRRKLADAIVRCCLSFGEGGRMRSLSRVSRKQRYRTLDFPAENRVPTGMQNSPESIKAFAVFDVTFNIYS